jgi:hypothetical protein
VRRLANGKIIDARVANQIEAVLVVLPVFISVGAEPIPGGVAPFVREPNRDAMVRKSPQLFIQAAVKFFCPLALQESGGLGSADDKFGPIPSSESIA